MTAAPFSSCRFHAVHFCTISHGFDFIPFGSCHHCQQCRCYWRLGCSNWRSTQIFQRSSWQHVHDRWHTFRPLAKRSVARFSIHIIRICQSTSHLFHKFLNCLLLDNNFQIKPLCKFGRGSKVLPSGNARPLSEWAVSPFRMMQFCSLLALHQVAISPPFWNASCRAPSHRCSRNASTGKIYIWNVQTGELMRIWDAHFKKVIAFCFLVWQSSFCESSDNRTYCILFWVLSKFWLVWVSHQTRSPLCVSATKTRSCSAVAKTP